SLLGAVLDRAQLDAHLLEPYDETILEPVGRDVTAAAAGNQRLDVLLQPELAQAGRALVEVLAHLLAHRVVDLAVEVEVDLLDHVGAVGLVWRPAAHRSAS